MEWKLVLSNVLQAVLIVMLPPLIMAMVKWLLGQARLVWEQAKQEQPQITDLVEEAAHFAVMAAEQAGAAKLIKDKKEYALEIAETWLCERGITVNLDLVAAAIEKQVLELFNQQPQLEGLG